MSFLHVSERSDGKFCVRPITWSGEWDREGRLLAHWSSCFVSDLKSECEDFKKLCDDLIDGKNKSIQLSRKVSFQEQGTNESVSCLGSPKISLMLNEKEYKDDGLEVVPDLTELLKREYGSTHSDENLSTVLEVLMIECNYYTGKV